MMSSSIFNVVLLVHVLASLGVIGLVLVQHGKGADMGAAFGSGSAGSVFGARGSANFLSRTTAVLAATFFITSLGLAYLAGKNPTAPKSIMEGVAPAVVAPAESAPEVPVIPDEVVPGGAPVDENAATPVAPAAAEDSGAGAIPE
jgi:preprotein translocase subunit SecG